MGNPDDRDRERSRRNQGRGADFNQQGQQVNGPQYNAERINFNESASADVIAEGIRRSRKPPPRRGISIDHLRHQEEEGDLKRYGYRHYTRDRERWLRSLAPRERRDEKQREHDRLMSGTDVRYHRRILRAGKLSPDTSPADPRYVEAMREVERKKAKRGRYTAVASTIVMIVLMLIAVRDLGF